MNELPNEVAELLRAERQRSELAEQDVSEQWNAFQVRLAALPARLPNDGAATGLSPRVPGWMTVTMVVAAFGGGVLVGQQFERRPQATPSPSATVSRSQTVEVEHVPSAPPLAVAISPEQAPEPPPAAAASTKSARPAPTVAPNSSVPATAPMRAPTRLSDERALVEGARVALLRGRPADALTLAQKHESAFASGELAEERDFILISALRDLGRTSDMKERVRMFSVRYPKSALRPTVEALAASP